MARPIITLTTDYGTNDHLVGTLKGVILKINPDVTIVDITHDVTPYDLLDGALTIGSAYSYFPARTIHVVVVDPGVGTERRPLLVSGETNILWRPITECSRWCTNAKRTCWCGTPTLSIIICSRSARRFMGAMFLRRWRRGWRKARKPQPWARKSRTTRNLPCPSRKLADGGRQGRGAARRQLRQPDHQFPRGRFAGGGDRNPERCNLQLERIR